MTPLLRYRKTDPSLFPTVTALKKLLETSNEKRGVLLFLDLHGHSKKKNAFLYGSDCTLQSDKLSNAAINYFTADEIISRKIFARTFPKVVSTLSDYFSYRDSAYQVKNSKKGTGRVYSWRELGIEGAFTIEASFCGSGKKDCLLLYPDIMYRYVLP